MTVIGEIRDAVGVLANVVDETRTILDALRDGRAYLQRHHPDARGDLVDLLEQMRTTVAGLVSASRVVTDFDFVVDGSARDRAPDRFNDHLIAAQQRVAYLESELDRLKASCSRIGILSDVLQQRADNRPCGGHFWATAPGTGPMSSRTRCTSSTGST